MSILGTLLGRVGGAVKGMAMATGAIAKEATGTAIGHKVAQEAGKFVEEKVFGDEYGVFSIALNSIPRHETENLRRRLREAKAVYRENKMMRLLMKIPTEHRREQYILFDRMSDGEFEEELMYLENDTAAELAGRYWAKTNKVIEGLGVTIESSGLGQEAEDWAMRQQGFRARQKARARRSWSV